MVETSARAVYKVPPEIWEGIIDLFVEERPKSQAHNKLPQPNHCKMQIRGAEELF